MFRNHNSILSLLEITQEDLDNLSSKSLEEHQLTEIALNLFEDYIKRQILDGTEPFVRFFSGHWNRSHTGAVKAVIDKHDFGVSRRVWEIDCSSTVDEMLVDLRRELISKQKHLKEDGTLAKRISFIQTLAKKEIIDLEIFCDKEKFKKLCESSQKEEFINKIDEINSTIQISVQTDFLPGNGLFITGADAKLGNWNEALPMKSEGKVWTFELKRSLLQSEFKFLVGPYSEEKTNTSELVYENGMNRKFNNKLLPVNGENNSVKTAMEFSVKLENFNTEDLERLHKRGPRI